MLDTILAFFPKDVYTLKYYDKQVFFIGLLIAFIPWSGRAQENRFIKSYGGSADETGLLVVPRDGGGFFLAGYAESVPGFGAAVVIRTDEFGETLWTRTIVDSGGTVILRAAAVDDEGGCILTGQQRNLRGDWDMLALRIDSAGERMWHITSGSSSDDIATAICDAGDGWMMVGNTLQTGGYDVRLVKLDRSGNQIWSRVIGGTQTDLAYGVTKTDDMGFVIAGTTYASGSHYSDVLLFKVNYWGELVWWRQFGGWFWDEAQVVIQTPDLGFAVGGFSSSYGDDMDGFLARINASGDTTWWVTYFLPGFQRVYGLNRAGDSGFVLVGENFQTDAEADLLLLRSGTQGQLLWYKSYGSEGYDCGRAIVQLHDGGFVSTGRTWIDSVNRFDIYLVRTDSFGEIGMDETQNCEKKGNSIFVFPNPFINKVCVEMGGYQGVVKIFSADGAVIRVLSGISQPVVEWDGCDFQGGRVPAGVYILRIPGQAHVKLLKCN
ncbi:MAG: hypothetical protein ACUVUR_00375 [bacterium]